MTYHKDMKIKLPAKVKIILDTLHQAGYEAYAVGGCVRDTILMRTPDDWDITTSARPEEIKRVFARTIDTGIEHGTVTVLIAHTPYEVTTYRVDGVYTDHRRPDSVSFSASLGEDLARRDFTINAMAYNEEDGLVDRFGGMQDLQRKIVRCVGAPAERFGEDALRILRAVRFSAQLGFSIDPATRTGIEQLAPTLANISAERICTELVKLITSKHPDYLYTAWELGVTKIILPEFDRMMETPQNTPYHYLNVGEHTLTAMCAIPEDRILRLTMLLHDMGKPACRTTDSWGVDHFKGHGPEGVIIADKIMHRLRMDNDTIHKVKTLIKYHDWRMHPEQKEVRHAAARVGAELFPYLMQVQYADALAQSDYIKEQTLQRILDVWEVFKTIMDEKQCVTVKDLAVNGGDLIRLGFSQGPTIGAILQELLEIVLDDPQKNEREWLLEYAAANKSESE